ncbi:MAG: hypothetical protein Q9217_004264 [Psora testacea]
MPSQQCVAVDSSPKLHSIFDTINTTLAASEKRTLVPVGFYDARARKFMDLILMEEEYSGYAENLEYRQLGIGHLLAEVVSRLRNDADVTRFALFGCHDSTLAAPLGALGALKGENDTWPAYTSSIAIELFHERKRHQDQEGSKDGLSDLYVRIRYNDRPVYLPGCQKAGDHLRGDKGFCTLARFKDIVDKFTPVDWKSACVSSLGNSAFPKEIEPAGV